MELFPGPDRDRAFVMLEEERGSELTDEDPSSSEFSSQPPSEPPSAPPSSHGLLNTPPSYRSAIAPAVLPSSPASASASSSVWTAATHGSTRSYEVETRIYADGAVYKGDHEAFLDPKMEARFAVSLYRDAFEMHMSIWATILFFRLAWIFNVALSEDDLASSDGRTSPALLFGPAPRTSSNSIFVPAQVLILTSRYMLHQMADTREAWHWGSRGWVGLCLVNGLYSATMALRHPELISTEDEREAGAMSVLAAAVTALLLGVLNGSHGLAFIEKQFVFVFFMVSGAVYMIHSNAAMSLFFVCVIGWIVGGLTAQLVENRMRRKFMRAVRAAPQLPNPAQLPLPRNDGEL